MIQVYFTGDPYPSLEEQEKATNLFIEKLGPFKDEFVNSGGVAVFNYSFPSTDNRRISLSFSDEYNLPDFIGRFQVYRRTMV